MKHILTPLVALAAMLLMGCQSYPQNTSASTSAAQPDRSTPPDPNSPLYSTPLAFVDAKPVTWTDMDPLLMESSGGQVLADLVLEDRITQRLAEQGKHVGPAEIQAERRLLLETLDPNPDRALRLLRELRDRHGFGQLRFDQLLTRNAGLRMLVQPDVQVSDAAVRQDFDLYYGPRYQARIITTLTLSDAEDIIHRARAGESFSDLAVQRSTDPSKAQGGLLSPISPADPTYPDVIRAVLVKLKVGAVSDPLVLETGYAVLKLERIIPAQNKKLNDVKAILQMRVRRDVERMLMDRLVRTMVQQADVVVMSPALQQSWTREKQRIVDGR